MQTTRRGHFPDYFCPSVEDKSDFIIIPSHYTSLTLLLYTRGQERDRSLAGAHGDPSHPGETGEPDGLGLTEMMVLM